MSLTLPSTEFERINRSIEERVPGNRLQNTHRKALQEKSMKRISSWSDTLEEKRRMQDMEKEKRLAAEEEARRRLDLEEAEIQFRIRKAAIEKANEKL
jgi:hypothetical protein